MAFARRFEDLVVYQIAFRAAGRIFTETKGWPAEERYGLTSQIRNSSRSVCGNIAEAWRKRRYPNHFVSKLTDADGEAAETQNWLKFAIECGYMSSEVGRELYGEYDRVSAGLVDMMSAPQRWCGPTQLVREEREEYAVGGSSLKSQALADRGECERRKLRLGEPHVAPLTQLVERLRSGLSKSAEDIPDFDPEDGGINARVLLLLQDPGVKAIKSGFISRDNPDSTALCLNETLRQAGLMRSQYAIWNIVPWRGALYPADLDTGRSALTEIVSLMPNLKIVIAFGKRAQCGLDGHDQVFARRTTILAAPHPSQRNTNRWPEAHRMIVEALIEAAKQLRSM
jgi:four helix bundle protein